MMFYAKAISFLALVAGSSASLRKTEDRKLVNNGNGLMLGQTFNGQHSGASGETTTDSAPSSLTLTLTNTHAFHHFGLWFVAVHAPGAINIFEINKPASAGLGQLCMTGDASLLVTESDVSGVSHVAQEAAILQTPAFEAIGSGGAGDASALGLGLGNGSLELTVPLASEDSVVTIAGMIANSNDGCVVLNGARLRPGMTVPFVEIDAGTEGNDEECTNIGGCLTGAFGGPSVDAALSVAGNKLCPCPLDTGNTGTPQAGEGFMSYHRGIDTLPGNDWRDHMVWVTVS